MACLSFLAMAAIPLQSGAPPLLLHADCLAPLQTLRVQILVSSHATTDEQLPHLREGWTNCLNAGLVFDPARHVHKPPHQPRRVAAIQDEWYTTELGRCEHFRVFASLRIRCEGILVM